MKSVFASKTVWFNILTLAATAIAALAGSEIVMENPALASAALVASSVVNLGLRLLSSTAVTVKSTK